MGVIGQRSAVLAFSRRARIRPSLYFQPDILVGEAQELFAERTETFRKRLAEKVYKFQIRNDDGKDHFRSVSSITRIFALFGIW